MHGIIPIRVVLASMTITVERACPRSNQEDETVLHALRHCPIATGVWQQLNFTWDNDTDASKGVDWVVSKLNGLSQQQIQQLAITMWAV